MNYQKKEITPSDRNSFGNIIEEFKVDDIGYTYMKVTNSKRSDFSKEIEKDIDNTTYYHVSAPLKDSIWNMISTQANRSLELTSMQCYPDNYDSQKHDLSKLLPQQLADSYLELFKDYGNQKILIVIRLPTCEAALQYFLTKDIDTMNCIDMVQTLVKHVAATLSVNESYVSGTLLGDYN